MANMSYTRFQNTLPDLRDCVESLDDVESPQEKAAAKKMYQACLEFVKAYEEMNEDE
jgi:hypothetical protein